MAPLFLFIILLFFFFIWDSTYSHSLRSFSSTVKLLITTGFISMWGEAARITVWMLLLGEEEGGVFCSNLGGLLVCVFRGNGLAPTLFFRCTERMCIAFSSSLSPFSCSLFFYILNSLLFHGPG